MRPESPRSVCVLFGVLVLCSTVVAAPPFAHSQSCNPAPPGVIGWWPAEGNAHDRSDGNHGALQGGAAFATGRVGQGFLLDGADDWVGIPDAPALRPTSVTLEGWFKFSTVSGGRILITKTLGTAGLNSYVLFFNGSGIHGAVSDLGGFGPFVGFTFTPVTGTWYHLAYTFSDAGNTQSVYLDGVLKASGSVTKSIAYDGRPVQIGAELTNDVPGGFFGGQADEVGIYDRALSNVEIQAIVAAGSAGKCDPAPASCAAVPADAISWWAGEGNSLDRVDGNHGDLQNGATFGAGWVGQAFSLDGVDDWVAVPDGPSLRPTSVTLEGWFNFSDASSSKILVTKSLGTGSLNSYTLFFDGSGIYGVVSDLAGFGPFVGIPFSPVPGAWYHLAYTFDDAGNHQAVYVNGVVRASSAVTKSIAYDSHPVQIGAEFTNETPAAHFGGLADEVTLYGRSLSAAEIQAVYLARATGKCLPADRAPIVSAPATSTAYEGQNMTLSVGAFDPDGDTIHSLTADLRELPAGHGATFTPNGTNTEGTLAWTPTFADAGSYSVRFIALNALADTSTAQITVENVVISSSIVGRVSADCPSPGAGLLGVTVDAYVVGSGDLIGTSVTDANGDYIITALLDGEYTVTIVPPIGTSTPTHEVQVYVSTGQGATVDFPLACVTMTIDPRAIGYWKHQVGVATGGRGTAQVDGPTLCGYLDLIDGHFNSNALNQVVVYQPPSTGSCADKVLVAKALLNLHGSVAMVSRARQQLLALLLNVAAGSVNLNHVISVDGATVSQAITYCDHVIDDSTGNHDLARTICDLVNNGAVVPAGMIPLGTQHIAYARGPMGPRFAVTPNPGRSTRTFTFVMPRAGRATLNVYDVSGRLVATLVDGWLAEGEHAVSWNGLSAAGDPVSRGMYLARLRAPDFDRTLKLVQVRR